MRMFKKPVQQVRSENLLTPHTSYKGSGRGCPLLRASNEHILIVRVLRAKRAPRRSLPILPLQSAVQGMPREAARFLCPDWLISGGADDLHCRVTLDSSNW